VCPSVASWAPRSECVRPMRRRQHPPPPLTPSRGHPLLLKIACDISPLRSLAPFRPGRVGGGPWPPPPPPQPPQPLPTPTLTLRSRLANRPCARAAAATGGPADRRHSRRLRKPSRCRRSALPPAMATAPPPLSRPRQPRRRQRHLPPPHLTSHLAAAVARPAGGRSRADTRRAPHLTGRAVGVRRTRRRHGGRRRPRDKRGGGCRRARAVRTAAEAGCHRWLCCRRRGLWLALNSSSGSCRRRPWQRRVRRERRAPMRQKYHLARTLPSDTRSRRSQRARRRERRGRVCPTPPPRGFCRPAVGGAAAAFGAFQPRQGGASHARRERTASPQAAWAPTASSLARATGGGSWALPVGGIYARGPWPTAAGTPQAAGHGSGHFESPVAAA